MTAEKFFLNGRLQNSPGGARPDLEGYLLEERGTMAWLCALFATYVVMGVLLTRRVCGPLFRLRTYDHAVGALFMPAISVLSVLFHTLRSVWSALLTLLDFHPDD